MSSNTKKSTGNAKYVIPEDVDPIKLADEIKKGMGEAVLEDYRKVRRLAAKLKA